MPYSVRVTKNKIGCTGGLRCKRSCEQRYIKKKKKFREFVPTMSVPGREFAEATLYLPRIG